MKKCGFVIRVSTDRQAKNKEGSLKNQLQRLRAHVEYKNVACGEQWVEVEKYILKAVSGKDSFRSKEFARLFEDIRIGKINTVICTALDRISRSVKDFLNFFEILNKYNVEFVCLKQNYDTTSSQGKLFITIMMALAEFEREQTSERNKDATMARAERGLWNGGQILGYDLDPNRKGYLIPNEKEKALVNFAYDTYLQCGSILETAKIMNKHGYRTKEYTSRRDKFHPAEEFCYSSVQCILTNYAYIGKKEINKKKRTEDQEKLPESERYRIVDAVWEPIVDKEKFYSVQALLKKNCVSKHNEAKPVKHNYILNGGLLWCGKCGKEMEGRSGTGARGVRYYYYICKNKECKFKVPADEIEGVVLKRIKELSTKKDIMESIIKSTNEKLQKELPQLKEQKTLLQKELTEIKNFADGIMNKWASLASEDSSLFLKDKLDQLGKRRKEIETGIQALEEMIEEIERESVTQELVMLALNKFTDVFDHIQPYQQKELLSLVLHKAILAPDSIKIALYGRPPEIGLFSLCESEIRSQTPIWLLGQGSNLQPSG
ncbi:MAG: recombinase family protein [Candidatus Caldatribacteriota bacterium]